MSEPNDETAETSSRPTSRRPTMQDIADRVGLSRPLVSIVLRGAEGASEGSRERVLAVAREIGYYPDESARLLRQRRSRQIGVLFTNRQPFEADLVDALHVEAAARDVTLVLSHIGQGRSQETALNDLMKQRLETLIVLATQPGTDLVHGLPSSVPVVLLGGPHDADLARDEIRVQNSHGIALAIDHLVDLGHEQIAFVGPRNGPNAAERRGGYADRMGLHGLGPQVRIYESEFTEAGGYRSAREFLNDDARPTAVVCANDRCALGFVETVVRAGVTIPGELSVVGFDDSSVARLPFLNLTSVRPDPSEMARLSLDAAERLYSDPKAPPKTLHVDTSLVVRETTQAPGILY